MYIPKFPEIELVKKTSMKRQVGRMIVLIHTSRSPVRSPKTSMPSPMSMLGYHVKSHKRRLQNVP